nr:MAG TPA: hypothetical protein [Caudoviricetes sp.]
MVRETPKSAQLERVQAPARGAHCVREASSL